ncbi:MAG: Glycosyl transferase, group 1 [uncultured Nocardioidaceae bacterium]|uniref:Glycosyl transferase, group 1 n=1 Tax=uncultured Nocardioidaceae bacterium TaxID=253824 RepID=A0A6J4M6K9_9ACTN|nr:MAG: Glycosyl transferase, group 1 [uncultured Nocardioidaceae bacterium]
MHVLRLTSVFEPQAAALDAGSARFDPIGGMQNHTAALTRCLDALGVRQTVLTSRLAAPTGSERLGEHAVVRRTGLRTTRLRQLWALGALPSAVLPAMRRGRHRVDLVHGHQGEDIATLALAILASAVHRCPLVVTLHCSVRHTFAGGSPKARFLRLVGGRVERAAVRRAAAVVVLVPRTAELLREDGVAEAKVHVLPSGFDPALFERPTGDRFPGVPHPRVGYVGRLAEQKRPDLLVQAFGDIRVPASLVVVGDGPLRPQVEAAVRRSPVRERITLEGFVPHEQVPAVLRSLDLLVLPSVYEEMGSVLAEAMACGLPVVASDVGGIPDVVRDGETGILVPPGDVTALGKALDSVLEDDELRERLGQEARQQSVRYSWPGLAARVADLYAAACTSADRR